jgi:hypothetical protein
MEKLVSRLDWQPMAFHAGFVNDHAVIVGEDASIPKSRSPRMNNCTKPPTRLSRAESFIGFHFDFHATTDNEPIGGRPFQRDLARMLREAKPDYVQCDCKGHPGVSSYPTKAGNPAPKFAGDALKVWREVTAKQGVALFMHYSGVWDTEALRLHPEWARVDEKGKRDPNNTSVFGRYVHELMIPQLVELRREYDVDGFWVDGDCWATGQDYHPAVLKKFRSLTGLRTVPKKLGDVGFFEFTEMCREAFREYVRTYVNALHAQCPGVQVASNWAFSSFMPEPVSVDVDFLSGDYAMIDAVNSARFEGRCLMHQGKAWDLMAWAFAAKSLKDCFTAKPVRQIQREAAVVLALGGGIQVYFQQRRDGSLPAHEIETMTEVAKFCRRRQKFCHRATSIPQVAVLLSKHAFYQGNRRVFGAWDGNYLALWGLVSGLIENQTCVDVVGEHHLSGSMDKFPLIIIPEWDTLEEGFREELLAYVRNGGRLLVIGCGPTRLFAKELGITITDEATQRDRWLAAPHGLAGVRGAGFAVKCARGTRVTGVWHEERDPTSTSHPAVVQRKLGRGIIAALCLDFGTAYREHKTSHARDFLGALVRDLFPNPIVEVQGTHLVDVSLMTKAGDLFVHLVNASGPHAQLDVPTHDAILPIHDVQVRIRLDQKPSAVTHQPAGTKIPFTWSKGVCTLRISKIDLHEIIQIRPTR